MTLKNHFLPFLHAIYSHLRDFIKETDTMKTSIIVLFLFHFLFLSISCSSEDETADDPIALAEQTGDEAMDDDTMEESLEALTLTDVSYGSNSQQVYDLFLPEARSSSSTKVVVLIHGGGWTSGDKSDMTPFVEWFLERHPDHAVLNLNYVLAQVTGPPAFPNQYLDIQAALNQVIEQREELQILPEFGFFGTSAGAHLAMMYDYTYDSDDHVKFVIDIVGPSDLTDPFFADDPNFHIALSLLADASQFPGGTDLAVANSPALVASANSSPTLLFYGDMDPIVPLTNGQTLDNALSALNIEHTFTVYEGGHGDDWGQADGLDLLQQTNAYMATYLEIE